MKHFSFVLIPGFSMLAFSCTIDALRAANEILGSQIYTWQALSPDGILITSSTLMELQTTSLEDAITPNVIVICGGDRSHTYSNPLLTGWLHEQAKDGKAIGSISDGSFVVAATGLFDKCPSTIHWRCHDAYRERYPKLEIKASIIETSGNRFSCAGGTSSLDLMLHFISKDHGNDVAGQIANNYFHDTIRDGSREQHMTNAFRIATRSPQVANALLLMEENLETPLSISFIANTLGISRRQLDRLFKKYLNNTPQEFYHDLRLVRASGLLLQTGMKITEIALSCGFQSASHMGKYFSAKYSATPSEYRQKNLSD